MNVPSLVAGALDEDLGPAGDITTMTTVPPGVAGQGVVISKEALVVCGQDVAREVVRQVAARIGEPAEWSPLVPDGASVADRAVVARVGGSYRTLLIAERTALNLMMRLSGIATNTRRYVDAAGPDGPAVVDTRKTTPLHRALEKYAVRCGGGKNHRFGLFDGVLIKDNHLVAAGGVTTAVQRARAGVHHLVRVQVEVTDLQQLDEALAAGADAVLLDNMDDAGLAAAVARVRAVRPRVVVEASGNMNPTRIAAIRHLGLDVVSAGGLIHQARWVDLSLDLSPTG